MRETGVYCILNRITGKCYVGSSSRDIYERWWKHCSQLRRQQHPNIILQNSWNKYGEKSFELLVLEIVEPSKCIEREQFYIDGIKPELNILKIAGSRLGAKMATKTKERLSKLALGRTHSLVTRQKMSFARQKENLSPITLKKMSDNAIRINQLNKIKITQLTQEGQPIKTWDSLSAAAQAIFSSPRRARSAIGDISAVCKKKTGRNSAYGFRWEYA